MRGGLELGVHHGIHLDVHLLLLVHRLVALLDLVLDPGLERLADHGGADVDDPLLGRLRQVRVVGHVGGDVGVLAGELGDVLEVQALVLRHVDRLDRLVAHVRLLARENVFQEVDRDVGYKEGEIRMS